MLYRPYVSEDFASLYAIEETCFHPPFRFDVEYMLQLVQSSNTATWIAEENDRMVGFAILEWSNRKTGTEGYIQTIEVTPKERGHGAGRELLARVENSANSVGCRLIRLHVDAANAGAIHLYEALGYTLQGRTENYYARRRAALVYRKLLEAN